MSIWADAAAVIAAAFADEEAITYYGDSGQIGPIYAIRSEARAPTFEGPGSTLRTISYEFRKADLPLPPAKREKFAHRGRLWQVEDITSLDDVGAWSLVVVDAGAIE